MTTKELLLEANEALAEGRVEDFIALCAPDVTMRWPGTARVWTGREQLHKNLLPVFGNGVPWDTEVHGYIVEGDRGMGHGIMTMRQPDGGVGVYHFSDIYQFRDGQIVEIISYMIFPQPERSKTN